MIDLNPDFADVPTSFALGGTVLIGQITGIALFITTVSLMHASRAFASLGRLSLAQVAIIGIIYLSVVLQLHDDEAASWRGVTHARSLASVRVRHRQYALTSAASTSTDTP